MSLEQSASAHAAQLAQLQDELAGLKGERYDQVCILSLIDIQVLDRDLAHASLGGVACTSSTMQVYGHGTERLSSRSAAGPASALAGRPQGRAL